MDRGAGSVFLEALIIAGLSAGFLVLAIFVFHPGERLAEIRDSGKISAANGLKAELLEYFSEHPAADCGSADSPASSLPDGFSYRCDSETKTFEISVDLKSARYSKSGGVYKVGNQQ